MVSVSRHIMDYSSLLWSLLPGQMPGMPGALIFHLNVGDSMMNLLGLSLFRVYSLIGATSLALWHFCVWHGDIGIRVFLVDRIAWYLQLLNLMAGFKYLYLLECFLQVIFSRQPSNSFIFTCFGQAQDLFLGLCNFFQFSLELSFKDLMVHPKLLLQNFIVWINNNYCIFFL